MLKTEEWRVEKSGAVEARRPICAVTCQMVLSREQPWNADCHILGPGTIDNPPPAEFSPDCGAKRSNIYHSGLGVT